MFKSIEPFQDSLKFLSISLHYWEIVLEDATMFDWPPELMPLNRFWLDEATRMSRRRLVIIKEFYL